MKEQNEPLAISRKWEQYMVKAVLKEEADSGDFASSSVKEGFESHFFVLPTPIVTKIDDLKQTITIRDGEKIIRIYPPFPLNEKAETSGAFDEVSVPEEKLNAAVTVEIPTHAVKGVRMEHGIMPGISWCRGLRMDVEQGADENFVLNSLLEHICQYTHQWWLRGTHNPFLGPARMGAALDENFNLVMNPLKRPNGERESSWYGTAQFQQHLGGIAPLTNGLWLLISDHISNKRSADNAILGVHDGFSEYMAGRDEQCILKLCIAVEIMLNKHRQAVLGRQDNANLDKLIRTTSLINEDIKEDLKKLAIDRGHVAHGKSPYILQTKPEYSLERYIQAVHTLMQAYLNSIPNGSWPGVMAMKL